MWFWRSDPAVPPKTRAAHAAQGLCKDEWPDNGHFPPQMYVREAARMIGDRVYVQQDRLPATGPGGCRNDSVAVASWGIDIHEMERVVVRDAAGRPVTFNEGLTVPTFGGRYFFEMPYYILLPKQAELTNLAAPNCPSVTHVTFAALREEPTLWQLGQAAGTAASLCHAAGGGAVMQALDVGKLQAALIKQHAFVHWPPRASCSAPAGPAAVCDAAKAVSISVNGAGTAAANGVYTRTGGSSDGFHVFAKDSGHVLYRWGPGRGGGAWRIGLQGHGLFYSETATGLPGPPLTGWTTQPNGTQPAPNKFACTF